MASDRLHGVSTAAQTPLTTAAPLASLPAEYPSHTLHKTDGSPGGCDQVAACIRDARPCTQELQTGSFPDKAATPSTEASSPRSLLVRPRRPAALTLGESNGATTISLTELKHAILDGRPNSCDTRVHVVQSRPPDDSSPTPSPIAMGNQPSRHPDDSDADHASLRSVVRNPMRMVRKSPATAFKRVDSKSPLPRPPTVTAAATQEVSSLPSDESPPDSFLDPPHSARDSVLHLTPLNSASPTSCATVTEDGAGRPLSATWTLGDSRPFGGSRNQEVDDSVHHVPPLTSHRMSALSPTIPAPSPLPEDSPHKYGLKDRMDTPELERVPELGKVAADEEVDTKKVRRRSNGVEIFNEAKSLQSASSFLNGLSTLRRRAESNATRTNEFSDWSHVNPHACPSGSHPSSSGPTFRPVSRPTSNSRALYGEDNDLRARGLTSKKSGFAFARPLNYTQLKCYRQHARLLPSRNRRAPVECAVCHMDDHADHWSCAWCAIRVCRFCKAEFEERGVGALTSRMKKAEMGTRDSSDGSLGYGK